MKKKQFAVIGLGRFGTSLATSLYEMDYDVLAVDSSAEAVEQMSEHATHCVQADATDAQALKALGIKNFDVAVISIGNDIQASILVTLLCKELGIKQVITKAQNELHARVLSKIGADKIVFPERDMGIKLARSLVSSNLLEYIELSEEYSLVEWAAPAAWAGKSIKELDIRSRYGVNIMAIKHGVDINISPRGEDTIKSGDILVMIGADKDLAKLEMQQAE